MLSGIISSKTRVKLLLRLFLNPDVRAYLRELTKEFGVSSNAVREELNNLKKARLIRAHKKGRNILYEANPSHPLFPELSSMAKKVLGIDQVIDGIVTRLGNLKKAFLIDDYAEGKDTGIIDLLLIGEIDQYNLQDLVKKTEKYIKRKIRVLVLKEEEVDRFLPDLLNRPNLLLWEETNSI